MNRHAALLTPARVGRAACVLLAVVLALTLALGGSSTARAAAVQVPTASVTVECTGYDALLDNSASPEPVEIEVDVNGVRQQVVVAAASAQRVSGHLPDVPTTVTVSSAGQVLASATLADDCLELGGGVQATARVRVGCSLQVRATLRNRAEQPLSYVVRVGERRRTLAVAAQRTREFTTTARAGQRVSVSLDGQVLDRARVPRPSRCP